jgi:hypothetical protein
MVSKTKLLSFALLAFCFVKSFAWGVTGHRVIAEVAERNLSKKTKREIKKIIGNQKLAYWANWPDFIKSDTAETWKSTGVWHFVNVSDTKDFASFSEALHLDKGPNLYTQIITLSNQIKDKNTQPKDREIAFRFLIHIMGDMSQPLHVGNAEDKGGNAIKVNFFGQPTNLHSLWDTKLVDYQQYSYTEYADVLLRKNFDKEEIQNGTVENWIFDSRLQADIIYADAKPNADYKYEYDYKFNELLERQLLNGGLRLAKMLNDIFDN